MNCTNQLRSSRTEYKSAMNPNICQFVSIHGIRGLCGIGVLPVHLNVYISVFKVVRDPCQKITLLLLKSKSVRVIVPESCF